MSIIRCGGDFYCSCRKNKKTVGKSDGFLEYLFNDKQEFVGFECADCKRKYMLTEEPNDSRRTERV